MTSSRAHVLALPRYLFVLRVKQLATALVLLGLTAYSITDWYSSAGIDLTLFTAIATMIISIYVIVAQTGAPVLYNYWAILGLDIFAVVFWIISFSIMASEVAANWNFDDDYYVNYGCVYYYGYCLKKRSLDERHTLAAAYTYRNSMAAAAGLGGLEFAYFVVTLVFTGVYLHRHRKAGGHCSASRSSAPVNTEPKLEQQPNGYPTAVPA